VEPLVVFKGVQFTLSIVFGNELSFLDRPPCGNLGNSAFGDFVKGVIGYVMKEGLLRAF
jgi:hypothetical protein